MLSENLSPPVLDEPWRRGGFGLYVHWPFCEAKCPYCDFNSHVVQHIDQRRWADALATEIRRYGQETAGRVLSSVFFGGGTPSLMEPDTVNEVLRAARETWPFANDIEITLEANPRSVEAARFEGYANAGVNRVSLGVQALRKDDLRRLGRLHDVNEAKTAFKVAQSVFERVSFDLIYARQDQSLQDWQDELSEALDMAADHLSLYQLTIEPGTAFWDRAQLGKLRGLPEESLSADMFELTQSLCEAAGMPAYEVSNHARPGAESRHNLVYWRSGDWVGVGPGAHGRLTLGSNRFSTVAFSQPGAWLAEVENGSAESDRDQLTVEDIISEYLMMGLRLNDGVDVTTLHKISRVPFNTEALHDLENLGMLEVSSHRVRTTLNGRMVLNSVLVKLLS